MLTHHVLFWLKADITDQEKQDFRKGLETLEEIEAVNKLYIGTPAAIQRPVVDVTYTFSLLVLFDNMAAHDVYQVHPIHKIFLENFKSFFEKVIIYDSI